MISAGRLLEDNEIAEIQKNEMLSSPIILQEKDEKMDSEAAAASGDDSASQEAESDAADFVEESVSEVNTSGK